MFSSRNKKNIDTFWLKKVPYQELWNCYINALSWAKGIKISLSGDLWHLERNFLFDLTLILYESFWSESLEGVLLPEYMLFPSFSIDLLHIRTCDVSMVWLTISIIVLIMWLSCDSTSYYRLVFASHTYTCLYIYIKKRKLQETRASCGHCKKNLTTCNYTSTICVRCLSRVCVAGTGAFLIP